MTCGAAGTACISMNNYYNIRVYKAKVYLPDNYCIMAHMRLLIPWRFATMGVLKLPGTFPHTLVATENVHILPLRLCWIISGSVLHETDL